MRILFVCVGNTCRSQMAEAIARHHGHDSASAGTHPGNLVSPNAITALSELGIDSSGLIPKSIDSIDWQSFDKIISMGCGVSCPTVRIDADWGLDDPYGGTLDVFKQTATTIEEKVRNLGD